MYFNSKKFYNNFYTICTSDNSMVLKMTLKNYLPGEASASFFGNFLNKAKVFTAFSPYLITFVSNFLEKYVTFR